MRYFLFAGELYEPCGGINDFVAASSSSKTLQKMAEEDWSSERKWWHIVDSDDFKVIYESKNLPFRKGGY